MSYRLLMVLLSVFAVGSCFEAYFYAWPASTGPGLALTLLGDVTFAAGVFGLFLCSWFRYYARFYDALLFGTWDDVSAAAGKGFSEED